MLSYHGNELAFLKILETIFLDFLLFFPNSTIRSWSVWAAITKYRRLVHLNNSIIFSQSRTGVPARLSSSGSFLTDLQTTSSLYALTRVRINSLVVILIRTLILSYEGLSLWPYLTLITSCLTLIISISPNMITLCIRALTYEFVGQDTIQPIAV